MEWMERIAKAIAEEIGDGEFVDNATESTRERKNISEYKEVLAGNNDRHVFIVMLEDTNDIPTKSTCLCLGNASKALSLAHMALRDPAFAPFSTTARVGSLVLEAIMSKNSSAGSAVASAIENALKAKRGN